MTTATMGTESLKENEGAMPLIPEPQRKQDLPF